ncbi:uncharacterized protein [Solanum lycopersicum]|uniref:uncharacterized protein n=1 Tax=Solanum lycopersicum TaxID=4081 RepID=UPI00374917F5
MSYQSHKQALMKVLDNTYVPSGTSSDNVAAMIHQVIRGHRISFCDDELPAEGRSHNKALHITAICHGKVVNRVLVVDESGLNICSLSTLRQLRFDFGNLEQMQVNVRAFDNVQRDTLGEVNLTLQMGPTEFSAKFQVLYIDTSYNLLLGRLFIHMVGAVPSTLHQMMKLVWKNEELVLHGEGNHLGKQVSVINEMLQGANFYTVELVNTTDDDLSPADPHANRIQNDSHDDAAEWVRASNISYRPTNVMSCHELNEQNETNDDKVDDYEEESREPDYVSEEFWQFKNQHKPNLEETEMVNLGDSECVKEIKEEITKQIESRLVEVTQYPFWLGNVVSVAKKDGKIRICVDYRDLNKASPKDYFPLQNIHILIDNCAKHEMQSFVDCYVGYQQILMDEEDVEKMAFITPWGVYHYRLKSFGLKNTGATYMRAMKTIVHDMIHREIEVAFGCVLGQHDETGKKEKAIYYISKKFTPYESRYTLLERTCCALTCWRLFFDGAANHQGKGIGAVLVSESGQHYPMEAKLRFNCTNNMEEYEAYIFGLEMAIDMNVYELLFIGDSDLLIHQVQGEWAVKNPKIIPYLDIELKEHLVHCSHVESEPDGLPWYFDIKRYLESRTYPKDPTSNQKKSIRRISLNFFLSGEVLYRRTPDLGLLRCVDVVKAVRLIEQIHAGICGTHMNGITLA